MGSARFVITADENIQSSSNQPVDIFRYVPVQTLEFTWLASLMYDPQPLIAGFYSKFIIDNLPQQTVCYMDPIAQPPTQNNIVKETMTRTLSVAR